MFLALEEVAQHLLALGVADLLQDDLLGGLGADAAEVDRLELFLDVFLELDVGHLLLRFGEADLRVGVLDGFVGHHLPAAERFELSRVLVDGDANVGLLVDLLLGGGGERRFQGSEHDVLGDVLLTRQSVHQQQHLLAHDFLLPILKSKPDLRHQAGLVHLVQFELVRRAFAIQLQAAARHARQHAGEVALAIHRLS
jgi:hypothetical protein